MAGKVRRVDYAPDEYISGVGGKLRADEQGIYWMICSLIMSEGEAIERDDRRLAGLCRIRPSDVTRITDKLLALGKLKVTADGKLYQNRALSEVERSANRIQTAIENGAKGGRPPLKDQSNQAADKAGGYSTEKLSLTINEQQSTEASKDEASDLRPKRQRRKVAYSPKFEEFWKAYPTDALMSKKDASAAFEKLEPEDQDAVISAVPAFRAHCSAHVDYRPVHAVRFITQGRYDGFLATAAAVKSRIFVTVGSPSWAAMLRKRNASSLPNSEHEGKRGWWFDQSEVAAALEAAEHRTAA
jgi:hypothetical protein